MCNDGANAEELAVQGMYGCWRDLYRWVWQAYQLTDDSWDPAGISDACNVRMPFGKVVNAAFLINYCLTDNYSSRWHSTEDYRSSSRPLACCWSRTRSSGCASTTGIAGRSTRSWARPSGRAPG